MNRPDDMPASFASYEVVRPLGTGGMAEVYLCRREGIGGFVKYAVVKRIKKEFASDESYRDAFLDEARIAGALNHPGIAQVTEIGEHDGLPYMVMEYVEGPTLGRLIRRGNKADQRIPAGVVARIGADVARALHYAHTLKRPDGSSMNLIHRDVSPSNVIVNASGATKLIDFGIARADGRLQKTEAGILKGKLSYVSPEALQNTGFMDGRADVYSLGASLYRAVTGQDAFQGDSQVDVFAARMKNAFLPPSEVVPDLPEELDAILMRAMAFLPGERQQDAGELAAELEAFCNGIGHEGSHRRVAALITHFFPTAETGPIAWAHTDSQKGFRATQSAVEPRPATSDTQPTVTLQVSRSRLRFALVAALLCGFLLVAGGMVGLTALWMGSDNADGRAMALVSEAESVASSGNRTVALDLLTQAGNIERIRASTRSTIAMRRDDLQVAIELDGAKAALQAGEPERAVQGALMVLGKRTDHPEAVAVLARARLELAAAARKVVPPDEPGLDDPSPGGIDEVTPPPAAVAVERPAALPAPAPAPVVLPSPIPVPVPQPSSVRQPPPVVAPVVAAKTSFLDNISVDVGGAVVVSGTLSGDAPRPLAFLIEGSNDAYPWQYVVKFKNAGSQVGFTRLPVASAKVDSVSIVEGAQFLQVVVNGKAAATPKFSSTGSGFRIVVE